MLCGKYTRVFRAGRVATALSENPATGDVNQQSDGACRVTGERDGEQ